MAKRITARQKRHLFLVLNTFEIKLCGPLQTRAGLFQPGAGISTAPLESAGLKARVALRNQAGLKAMKDLMLKKESKTEKSLRGVYTHP